MHEASGTNWYKCVHLEVPYRSVSTNCRLSKSKIKESHVVSNGRIYELGSNIAILIFPHVRATNPTMVAAENIHCDTIDFSSDTWTVKAGTGQFSTVKVHIDHPRQTTIGFYRTSDADPTCVYFVCATGV